MVGGIALLAALLVLVSVLEPRMVGKQEFGLTKAMLTLEERARIERSIVLAEQELATQGRMPTLDEVVGGGQEP
jgi:hypothetical protein